jgi:hypothetical protein
MAIARFLLGNAGSVKPIAGILVVHFTFITTMAQDTPYCTWGREYHWNSC